MTTLAEPTRDEVLQWLTLTESQPIEAVDHFWPRSADADRDRLCGRVRQWLRRARNGEITTRVRPPPVGAAAGEPPEPPPSVPAREPAAEPEEDVGIPALRRQLAARMEDVERARKDGRLQLVKGLDERVSKVRAELEAALERERKIVRLDPTPAAICAELERRAEAIALRAEMYRRRALRGEEG